jgi:uncharacterized paraquat-inducible protein A
MLMAEFDCPHCGLSLEAPAQLDGETHACPRCERPVTLRVVTTTEAVKAGMVAGIFGVLAAAIFGGGDN